MILSNREEFIEFVPLLHVVESRRLSVSVCEFTAHTSTPITVRTTRPEKYEIFTQRYQSQPITSKFQKKNTAIIFLTFRNHVKIFLSQDIMQNI